MRPLRVSRVPLGRTGTVVSIDHETHVVDGSGSLAHVQCDVSPVWPHGSRHWISLGWASYFVVHPEAAREIEAGGLSPSLMYAIVGAAVGALALFVLTWRPYRPDLGDAAFADRTFRLLWGLPKEWSRPLLRGADEGDRTWWTGDLKRQ